MVNETRGRRSGGAGASIAFLFVFFLLILLGSLPATPADAAALSGFASCRSLHLKSTGPCVRQLQAQLDVDGVSPHLRVDGIFGNQTRRAVENFQRTMNLPVDGVAGSQTFSALEQPRRKAAGTPALSTPGLVHVKNFWDAFERHTGPTVLAICAIAIVLLVVAAICRVKSLYIKVTWRSFESHFHRYPPQRLADSQARLINRYLDVQASHPGQLPPVDQHIRAIEGGDW
jgi:hypothetical protein